MKIIGVTGMPLSGKGFLAQRLIKKGFKRVVMSDAVRAEMKKEKVTIGPESLRNFATELREKYGRGIVATLCIPYLEKLTSVNKIVIDGVRSPEEINIFREKYGTNFVLISVNSQLKLRYLRLKRGRDDDPISWTDFQWRDQKELGWGLRETIGKADYTITNNGTPNEFEKKIDALLDKILS